jgi:hypothetical protein
MDPQELTIEEIKAQKMQELFAFMYGGGYFQDGINTLVTGLIDQVLNAGILEEQDVRNWAKIKAQIYIICNK